MRYHPQVTSRLYRATLLVGLVALASCSDDPARPPGSTPAATSYDISLERFTGETNFVTGDVDGGVLVGFRQMLLRPDGDGWRPVELPPGLVDVRGAWTTASGGIVLYDSRRIFRFNGAHWDYIAIPNGDRAICGLSTGEIFVGSYDGVVYRYSGDVWSVDSLAGRPDIHDLHGTSGRDAFAVSNGGTLWHFDGLSWSVAGVDSQTSYYRVFSPGPNTAMVMDGYGNVHEYRNGSMEPITFTAGFRASLFWGSGNDAYVAGRDNSFDWQVQHHDGSGWTATALESREHVRSGWTSPAGDIFTVTWDGLWRTRGSGSERLLGSSDPYREYTFALWASDDGVVAVGTGAHRFDGERWIDLKKEELTTIHGVAVHGTDMSNLYVVGDRMILHYDGMSWDWVGSGFGSQPYDVWASGRETFVVGSGGMIGRTIGKTWRQVDSPTTRSLLGVAGWEGGAVAVGEFGTILRFDGSTWETESSPVSWTITDVIAFGPNEIFAVGDDSRNMLVRDRKGWSERSIETYVPQSFTYNYGSTVWGTSKTNLFVGHYRGTIHHFDGRGWTELPHVLTTSLHAAVGTPNGDVFVAAEQSLLRYRRR